MKQTELAGAQCITLCDLYNNAKLGIVQSFKFLISEKKDRYPLFSSSLMINLLRSRILGCYATLPQRGAVEHCVTSQDTTV